MSHGNEGMCPRYGPRRARRPRGTRASLPPCLADLRSLNLPIGKETFLHCTAVFAPRAFPGPLLPSMIASKKTLHERG
jgi:hypothetical protein